MIDGDRQRKEVRLLSKGEVCPFSKNEKLQAQKRNQNDDCVTILY